METARLESVYSKVDAGDPELFADKTANETV